MTDNRSRETYEKVQNLLEYNFQIKKYLVLGKNILEWRFSESCWNARKFTKFTY